MSTGGTPYLRKFGCPLISKFLVVTWLSVCTYVPPSVRPYVRMYTYVCTYVRTPKKREHHYHRYIFVLVGAHQHCHVAKVCNASPRANVHKLQSDPTVHYIKFRTLNPLAPRNTRCACFGVQGDEVSRLVSQKAKKITVHTAYRILKGLRSENTYINEKREPARDRIRKNAANVGSTRDLIGKNK